MRILLVCSAFNGLSQRAWIELRESGHQVTVQISDGDESIRSAVAATDPDLVICPFLRERVPEDVWRSRPTIVIHPGPQGDRGPSSLDWAIMGAEPVWGVTALQAVDEMDAGPIWASRNFAMPADPPRKSDALQRAGHRRGAMASYPTRFVAKAPTPTSARNRWTTTVPTSRAPRPTRPANSTAVSAGPTPPTTSCAASVPQTAHPACPHGPLRGPGGRLRRAPRDRAARRDNAEPGTVMRASTRRRPRANRRRRDLDRPPPRSATTRVTQA